MSAFTALEPAQLINKASPPLTGSVAHGAVTAAAFNLNHGAVANGPFEVGQTITSTSGGTATIAAVPGTTQTTINAVAGAFNAGGTLTQTTGPNAGATAVQIGAAAPLPFLAGETLTSSSGGSATIAVVPSGAQLDLTGVSGNYAAGDTLTQTTGINAGATAVQSGEMTMLVFGPFSVKGFLNGRLRGSAHQDVAGVCTVTFGLSPASMDLSWVVPQDASQPGFQYPFDIIILQPFVSVTFVNGGGAIAFFRANLQALPI
jgi:hypothetical protein